MPLNVCLTRTPTLFAPKSLSFYESAPPIGLAYVAAAARTAGHRVELFVLQQIFLWSFFGVQYGRRPQRMLDVVLNLARGREESLMEKFLSAKFNQWVGSHRAAGDAGSGPAPVATSDSTVAA